MLISFLIHGPWLNNCLGNILTKISEVDTDSRYDINIVVVCYKADKENTFRCVNEISNFSIPIKVIDIKDIFNPGFCNINRQIISVQSGLEYICSESFVIKLRNDQIVDINRLMHLLDGINYLRNGTRKFLTTNCFTRKDRLYHPSDMFLAGWRNDLLDYYSASIVTDTAAEYKMKMVETIRTLPETFQSVFRPPESYLFTNYLKKQDWNIKNTEEDSFCAIKNYFYLVNSWDIDFRWNKVRAPYKEANQLILPMYDISLPPFGNWIPPIKNSDGTLFVENISCYERSDFEGNRTADDKYYVDLAKRMYRDFFQ